MENPLDSLCLLLREVKIQLPLNDGKIEEPIIYPAANFIQNLQLMGPALVQQFETAGIQSLNL
jgi:hypothetical protein